MIPSGSLPMRIEAYYTDTIISCLEFILSTTACFYAICPQVLVSLGFFTIHSCSEPGWRGKLNSEHGCEL